MHIGSLTASANAHPVCGARCSGFPAGGGGGRTAPMADPPATRPFSGPRNPGRGRSVQNPLNTAPVTGIGPNQQPTGSKDGRSAVPGFVLIFQVPRSVFRVFPNVSGPDPGSGHDRRGSLKPAVHERRLFRSPVRGHPGQISDPDHRPYPGTAPGHADPATAVQRRTASRPAP